MPVFIIVRERSSVDLIGLRSEEDLGRETVLYKNINLLKYLFSTNKKEYLEQV